MEPGGQGWNDPPNLSFQTKSQTTSRKNNLTKRVGVQDLNLIPTKSETISFLNPEKGPPIALVPSAAITKNAEHIIEVQKQKVNVSEILLRLVDICLKENLISPQVKKNVEAKLILLKSCLENSEYPEKIKTKMNELALHLNNKNYDDAWNVHTELMCDFPSQVTKWMVGVKKVIVEAKKIKFEDG